jgi:hypothetical protein
MRRLGYEPRIAACRYNHAYLPRRHSLSRAPRLHPNRASLSPTHVRDQPLARIKLRIRITTAFGFLASLVACTNPQWIQATHYDGVQPVPGTPSLRRLTEMQTEGPIEKQWVLAHR